MAWIIFVSEFKGVPAEKCDKIDDCSSRKSNGKVITLRKIDRSSGGPAFENIPKDDWWDLKSKGSFDWNPCTAFNKGSGCSDALMCENPNSISSTGKVLAQSAAKFTVNEDGSTTISYRSQPIGNTKREVRIKLKCDDTEYPGKTGDGVMVSQSGNSYRYKMTFTSKCACDDGCVTLTPSPVDPTNPADPTVKPKNKRLSKGSIILIIFFVLVFVYLICGILIKKFKMGAEGLTEMVPNFEFWADIPSLIKDGVVFTCGGLKFGCMSIYSKCCNRKYYGQI
ncbi:uncharacterized protein [Porites lutea]|uniref:uncharacterized protein n=1 Tax=Porites lutea TaxID=51062 RepID=UPI003CC5CDA4